MDEKRNTITSRQFMLFVMSAQIGVGSIFMPYALANEVGHDGWIPVVFSSISSIILAVILIKLLERYKNKNIYDINIFIYGKYMGTAINIFIIFYLTLKASVSLRIFEEVVHIIILKITPPLVITTVSLAPAIYMVWYGLKPISRFSNFIFPSLLGLLLLYIVSMQNIRPVFLLPLGISSPRRIISAMITTAYSFLSFVNVVIVYPSIKDKNKLLKHLIYAIIGCALFFITTIFVTTGFFGENMLKHLIFPLFSLANSYRAPLLERIDLYFMALWFPPMGMSLLMYYFVSYHSVNMVFNIKRKTISLIIFTMILIVLTRIPKDFARIYKYLSITDMIGVPLDFGLASLDYILSFFIKRGVKQK